MTASRPPRFFLIDLLKLEPTEVYGQEPNPSQPWRFRATLKVSPRLHSDFRTPTPGIYSGLDIRVGDYFTTQPSKVLKIISIEYQDEDDLIAIVEDELRLNSLVDSMQTGESSIETGKGILFEATNGLPVLYPLEGYSGLTISDLIEIQSRFFYTYKGSSVAISDLPDVNMGESEDGSVLVYNSALNTWVATRILSKQIIDGGEY